MEILTREDFKMITQNSSFILLKNFERRFETIADNSAKPAFLGKHYCGTTFSESSKIEKVISRIEN